MPTDRGKQNQRLSESLDEIEILDLIMPEDSFDFPVR